MKLIFAIFLVFVVVFDKEKNIFATPLDDLNKYTTKYDNIDVDRILKSKRLLMSYINCLLDKGLCSPDGRELKKYVPDALATNCNKCSDVQKKQAEKIFSHILLNNRDEWNDLVNKYDPGGNYRRKLYQQDGDTEAI